MDLIQIIIHNFFSFIVIISVIVFIHEFGHYYVAKKAGVRIECFSIGFGKEIIGWNDKSGTRWMISLVPLGGYVKMFGDDSAASNPDSDKIKEMSEEDRKVAFPTQPLLTKFLIVFAGPAANYILAIVILSFFFFHYGRAETTSKVGKVFEDGAAYEYGIREGDIITEIDGEEITRFSQLQQIISLHPGIEVDLKYTRNGKETSIKLTPQKATVEDLFNNKIDIGRIGVTASGAAITRELNFFESIFASVEETYTISVRTLTALGQIITGKRNADQLSGMLRIAEYSGKSVEKGMKTVFWFMAILSINLGLLNLFPIPMLDGGHLFFYIIEFIRRKPVSENAQEILFRIGFSLLVLLMVFATYNDLKHFDIF